MQRIAEYRVSQSACSKWCRIPEAYCELTSLQLLAACSEKEQAAICVMEIGRGSIAMTKKNFRKLIAFLCVLCFWMNGKLVLTTYGVSAPLTLNSYSVTLASNGVGSEFCLIPAMAAEVGEIVASYRSSDESVAVVSPEGLIRAVGEGTARVTVRTSIGREEFTEVTVMEMGQAVLPEDLVSIEDGAFRWGRINRIIIQEGVETIGEYAFADNDSLYFALIPDSVNEIADSAFNNDPNVCILCNRDSYAKQWAADRGILYSLMDGSDEDPVKLTYTANSRQVIGSTDACVARTISVSGASISEVTEVGCYLYNESGQLLGSKRESPTPLNGVINAWYDVEGELDVTLLSGITYSYRFVAVINGKEYYSDYDTFALKKYRPDEEKIQAVIDRAYAWVNYTWTAPVDIPVYNNVYNDTDYPAYYRTEYYFKAGTEMHGLPYTLSNSKYNLEKYAALSDSAKAAATTFSYSGVLMWGPKYAADCSELVSDCLYYGDPLIGTDGQTHFTSNKAYMYEKVSWDEIAPGDALAKTGHTMIVVDVSGNNITTIEQCGNGDDSGALHCTHVEAREAGGYYVCGTCEACAGAKKGATVLRTRTKAKLSEEYTVYRYLPLYQSSED